MIGKLTQGLGSAFLKLTGWTVTGQFPSKQSILVVAPHTSNWDFIYLMFLAVKWQRLGQVMWIGKHTLFRGPLNPLLRAIGGRPVHRGRHNNIITEVVQHLKNNPSMSFALAPEGTRSHTEQWKMGFYRIAQRSKLPLALVYLDFQQRRLGIGPTLELSGDMGRDLELINDFYQREWAAYPEQYGGVTS